MTGHLTSPSHASSLLHTMQKLLPTDATSPRVMTSVWLPINGFKIALQFHGTHLVDSESIPCIQLNRVKSIGQNSCLEIL